MNSEKIKRGRPSKAEMATKLAFCQLCKKNFKLPSVDAFLDHFGVHANGRRYHCSDCPQSFNNLVRWNAHSKHCNGTQINGLDKGLIHEWIILAEQCFPDKQDMLIEYIKKRGETLGSVNSHHPSNKEQVIRNNSSMNRVSSSNHSESTRTCQLTIKGRVCSQKLKLGSGKQLLKPLLDHVCCHTVTQRFRCSACLYQNARLSSMKVHIQKIHQNDAYFIDNMSNLYLHDVLMKAMECFPSLKMDLRTYVVGMAEQWISKRQIDHNAGFHVAPNTSQGPSNEDDYGLQNSASTSPSNTQKEASNHQREPSIERNEIEAPLYRNANLTNTESLYKKTIQQLDLISDQRRSNELINCNQRENYQTPEPEPLSRESTSATNYQRSENMAPQAMSSMSTTSNTTHHQTPMASLSTMVIKTENPSHKTPIKQTLIKTENMTPPPDSPTHPPVSYVAYQELLKKYELVKEDNSRHISRIGEQSAEIYTLKLQIEKLKSRLEAFEDVIELE